MHRLWYGALVIGLLAAAPAVADPLPAATPTSCSIDAVDASPAAATVVEPVETTDHCYVENHCYDGSTVSCTGETSCSSGEGSDNCGGWVECDGVREECPVVIEEGWSEVIGCCGSKKWWRHYSYRCGVLGSSESCADLCSTLDP